MRFTVNTVYLAFLATSAGLVHASVSQPCVQGTCTHSGGDSVNTLVHSLTLSASPDLLSDVTPSAGWNIQGCDPNWKNGTHIVQMTCEGTQEQTQHCNHLFSGGVENTIVHLPDNCGTGPFARVISVNQSANGVHTMVLDYGFTQIPSSDPRGNVGFALTIGNGASPKTNTPSTTSTPLTTSTDTALKPRFSEGTDHVFPFGLSKTVNLYSHTLNCSLGGEDSASLGLTISGTMAANGSAHLGGHIVGSLLPPNITDAALVATISGTASLTLNAEIALKLSLNSGQQLIASEGLPGLDFPGLFEIGPSLDLYTGAELIIDLQANAQVTAAWNMNNIGVTWPHNATQDVGVQSSNPVHISLNTAFPETAGFTGHVYPTFSFGVNMGDGLIKAQAQAQMDIFLNVIAELTEEVNPSKRDEILELEASDTMDHPRALEAESERNNPPTLDTGSNHLYALEPVSTESHAMGINTESRALEISTEREYPRDLEKRGLTACILVNAGFGASLSMQGDLGPLKGGPGISTTPLSVQLYSKCFGAGGSTGTVSATRRDLSEASKTLEKRDVSCPLPSQIGGLLQVLV